MLNSNNEELVKLGIAKKMPDGAIRITDQEAFFNLPFNRMMDLVRAVFHEINGIPEEHFLTEVQSRKMVKTWITSIRSIPLKHPDFNDQDHQSLDLQQLGILEKTGKLNEDRVTMIAHKVFGQNPVPSYTQILKTIRTLSHAGSENINPKNGNIKVGRNDLCPCGSGKKFKKCCLH